MAERQQEQGVGLISNPPKRPPLRETRIDLAGGGFVRVWPSGEHVILHVRSGGVETTTSLRQEDARTVAEGLMVAEMLAFAGPVISEHMAELKAAEETSRGSYRGAMPPGVEDMPVVSGGRGGPREEDEIYEV